MNIPVRQPTAFSMRAPRRPDAAPPGDEGQS
jgi:hypothetical protein